MIDIEAIDPEAIACVDSGGGWINTERINSQLSLLREKVIAPVDPGGWMPPETFHA